MVVGAVQSGISGVHSAILPAIKLRVDNQAAGARVTVA